MWKNIFIQEAKQAFYYAMACITHYLVPTVKETFSQKSEEFKEELWNRIKEDAKVQLAMAIEYVDTYFDSPNYYIKEKFVIDLVFKNVKLPWALKPLRPLLKKILKGKLRNLVKEQLQKLNTKF